MRNTSMRENIKQYVKIVTENLQLSEPIYEFGSLQVPGQEGFADLRPFFPKCKYVGADMCEGLGVDTILNLHSIDLPSGSVGSVLCLDTLEHVEYPHTALKEIHRILDPKNGVVVITLATFPFAGLSVATTKPSIVGGDGRLTAPSGASCQSRRSKASSRSCGSRI